MYFNDFALIIFPIIVSRKAEKESKKIEEWDKIRNFGDKINNATRNKKKINKDHVKIIYIFTFNFNFHFTSSNGKPFTIYLTEHLETLKAHPKGTQM